MRTNWVTQSKRVRITGAVFLLVAWFCCGVEFNDDPPRNAHANARVGEPTRSAGNAEEVEFTDASDAAPSLQDIGRSVGGSPSGLTKSLKTRGMGADVESEGGASSEPKTTIAPECGTALSTYRESAHFTATEVPRRWGLNHGASQAGATLTSTKRGPASNPSLCAEGCALLAFTIPAGTGWGGGAIVDEWFAGATNLYGATVSASVALELARPHLPVNVRLYTQGDAASNYSWGTTASLATATLADVSSFHELILHPANRKGARPFCASATGAVGIQVQRSRSSSVDIPVKLYIRSVMVGNEAEWTSQVLGVGGQRGRTDNSPSNRAETPKFGGSDGYCRLANNGAISVASDDWVAAGTCQGYGFTYATGQQKDTKIVPSCNASRCTPKLSKISAKGLCASGTIAADPTWKSKVGLGFDLDPTKRGTAGLALTYQMTGTAILRFLLDDGSGKYFCVELDETDENGSTVNLPWEYFTTKCWDLWDPGIAYNPTWPIKGMQLSASCLAARNSWFDMCVTGLATF